MRWSRVVVVTQMGASESLIRMECEGCLGPLALGQFSGAGGGGHGNSGGRFTESSRTGQPPGVDRLGGLGWAYQYELWPGPRSTGQKTTRMNWQFNQSSVHSLQRIILRLRTQDRIPVTDCQKRRLCGSPVATRWTASLCSVGQAFVASTPSGQHTSLRTQMCSVGPWASPQTSKLH
jgi:hypothetical protein